ncbi:hypothetical protein ACHAQJ_008191 [Trichoderma viride]
MTDDDKNKSLLQLSRRHDASIISQLVDIGSEDNQLEHAKFRSFVSELQCLQLKGTQLHRKSINAYKKHYVALSYTWDPSEHEDNEAGEYTVRNWDNNSFQQSKVRKCVLDRVVSYMRYAEIDLLWIDAHCIRQETCGVGDCTNHTNCAQKRVAIQAMDLVYQQSEHPVALLGRRLKNESELHLLGRLLSGKFVSGDRHNRGKCRLSKEIYIREARQALGLLYEITRDRWWERAWTFQENYRGGPRMQLLIRHDPLLESQKLQYDVFGEIPGEICVSSVTFSIETTLLCRALDDSLPLDAERIQGVLRAAGRYKLMLHESTCMTPTVIEDIEKRGLSEPWDRLAIVANCCQYPVRLGDEALIRQHRSLSLSVLAMCLLNGEILDNSNSNKASAAGLTTSKFLKEHMFRAFSAPEDDPRHLTYNKECRLTDVELMEEGIATKGHVWKLGCVIDTSELLGLPRIYKPNGRLDRTQRRRLWQLALHMNERHRPLFDEMKKYLDDDADAGEYSTSFTDMYLHHMALGLAAAIEAGKKLRLGAIWDPKGRPSPYRAVFIWPDEGDNGADLPDYVFTSVREGDPGSLSHDANDIDRHVTLNVELEEFPSSTIPHLRVHRWLHGMCFFYGCPRKDVIFPWPQALQDINPWPYDTQGDR